MIGGPSLELELAPATLERPIEPIHEICGFSV
jgi:hypothetical protein